MSQDCQAYSTTLASPAHHCLIPKRKILGSYFKVLEEAEGSSSIAGLLPLAHGSHFLDIATGRQAPQQSL